MVIIIINIWRFVYLHSTYIKVAISNLFQKMSKTSHAQVMEDIGLNPINEMLGHDFLNIFHFAKAPFRHFLKTNIYKFTLQYGVMNDLWHPCVFVFICTKIC